MPEHNHKQRPAHFSSYLFSSRHLDISSLKKLFIWWGKELHSWYSLVSRNTYYCYPLDIGAIVAGIIAWKSGLLDDQHNEKQRVILYLTISRIPFTAVTSTPLPGSHAGGMLESSLLLHFLSFLL